MFTIKSFFWSFNVNLNLWTWLAARSISFWVVFSSDVVKHINDIVENA